MVSISGRGQALEKVTATDLFYLRSMDEGMAVNVPYLLAQYLFRHADRRKCGARMIDMDELDDEGAHAELEGARGGGPWTEKEFGRATRGHGPDGQTLSRFTVWAASGISQLLDLSGATYTRYSETHVPYQRRMVRQRTNGASTSAPQQPDP
ncbi:hypothetical protein Tco_1547246 [Tanacetum coccineum]